MCPTRDRPTARRRLRLTSKAGSPDRKQALISMPLRVRKALSDLPHSDTRGKLLAALLSWEQQDPEPERRRRLPELTVDDE